MVLAGSWTCRGPLLGLVTLVNKQRCGRGAPCPLPSNLLWSLLSSSQIGRRVVQSNWVTVQGTDQRGGGGAVLEAQMEEAQ